MKRNYLIIQLLLLCSILSAQQVTLTPDQIKALTPEWKGGRSAHGRPQLPDKIK
jgi:hypothetical protein